MLLKIIKAVSTLQSVGQEMWKEAKVINRPAYIRFLHVSLPAGMEQFVAVVVKCSWHRTENRTDQYSLEALTSLPAWSALLSSSTDSQPSVLRAFCAWTVFLCWLISNVPFMADTEMAFRLPPCDSAANGSYQTVPGGARGASFWGGLV